MSTVIVSDTTSLIVLEKLQSLPLLCELFTQVVIPKAVLNELSVGSPYIEKSLAELDCIQIEAVKVSSRLDNLLLLLDSGEAHAIELAAQKQLPLIIDERKGRKIAQQLGIKITGFAGLLILAVYQRVLTCDAAITMLNESMKQGMRLSPSLHTQIVERLETL